jgi:hypothetical protein
MKNMSLFLLVSLALAFWPVAGDAQYNPTTIETIVTNPEKFADGAVEITGTVTLFAPAASPSTGHYLLKGASGTAIRVNTTDGSPELRRKYKVSGIVYLDPTTRVPFISEKSRVRTDLPEGATSAAAAEAEEGGTWDKAWLLLILVAALVGVTVLLFRRQSKPSPMIEAPASPLEPAPAPEQVEASPAAPAECAPDLKTVRIVPPSPKTMRYVPGELVVLSGEDKGKSFKIAGYPTPEGSVVTIGREPVADERAFAHIQIEERFHTVSRKQAELIWKEKKLFVKNLSDTNPTQVNGIEIKPGKRVQLKPGSIMRTGELEFEYKV